MTSDFTFNNTLDYLIVENCGRPMRVSINYRTKLIENIDFQGNYERDELINTKYEEKVLNDLSVFVDVNNYFIEPKENEKLQETLKKSLDERLTSNLYSLFTHESNLTISDSTAIHNTFSGSPNKANNSEIVYVYKLDDEVIRMLNSNKKLQQLTIWDPVSLVDITEVLKAPENFSFIPGSVFYDKVDFSSVDHLTLLGSGVDFDDLSFPDLSCSSITCNYQLFDFFDDLPDTLTTVVLKDTLITGKGQSTIHECLKQYRKKYPCLQFKVLVEDNAIKRKLSFATLPINIIHISEYSSFDGIVIANSSDNYKLNIDFDQVRVKSARSVM